MTRARTLLPWILAAYVLFLAWVLFNPSAGTASSTVSHVTRLLRDIGLSPGLITRHRIEFALNALMFAPVPFLAALLWPRLHWRDWTAYAFVASGCIELIQGVLLPARSAQFPDVVSNTLGALLGAVAALVWSARHRDAGA